MPAAAQRHPNLYPDNKVAPTALVVALQRALFVNKCYGNVRQKREDDGNVGPLTKKAIDVFVDEFRLQNPNEKPFASINELTQTAIDIETNTERNEVKFCERSRFRSQYFDGTEHVLFAPKYERLYPKGSVEIARMKTELFKNGCYGEIPQAGVYREDFGPLSRRALHVFVDEYALRFGVRSSAVATRVKGSKGRTTTRRVQTNSPFASTAELQRAAEREAPNIFCAGSRFMSVYFNDIDMSNPDSTPAPANPNVCEMPRAANEWLKNREDDSRSKYKGATPLPPLYSTLDGVQGAQRTLLEAISGVAPTNSRELGTSEAYRESYQNLSDALEVVSRNRSRLAKLGAMAQNDVCRKCFLVVNYEWLTRFAEFGRIPVTELRDNRLVQVNGGTPVRPLAIELNELYFDALLKSHTRIQDWKIKEERFLQVLRAAGSDFEKQRDARRAADIARSEATIELHSNNQRVPPSLRQPLDRASQFARQYAVSCIGDFSMEVER